MSKDPTRSASVGRRFTRGLEALVAAMLAVGAAVLVIDLSDRKYSRVDLSATGYNTLDPELLEILDRLPEPARIDLFLRPLEAPYDGVFAEGASRFLDELQRIAGARRDVIDVVEYEPGDLEGSLDRQRELGIEGANIVAVSCGDRRTTLRLFGDIVNVNWGNPLPEYVQYLQGERITGVVDPRTWKPNEFVPARVSSVRGSAALAEALLRVGDEERPVAFFVQGHGESDPASSGGDGVSRLKDMLEAEGFATEPWLGTREGALPENAALVLLIGPRQGLPDEDLSALNDYVAGGGQLIVAPSIEEYDRDMSRGARAVLSAHGLLVETGIVCVPLRSRGGAPVEGTAQVTRFQVGGSGLSASHPTTLPLSSDGRSLEFLGTPAFRRSDLQTVGGGEARTLISLASAPKGAWLDLPLPSSSGPHQYDYVYEAGRETRSRRLPLIMSAEYAQGTGGGRVLGIGSSLFLENGVYDSNHDFIRNAVNWMAHRETRLRIAARDPLSSRLNLREGRALTVLSYSLWLGLPLLCGLVAIGVALRRRAS